MLDPNRYAIALSDQPNDLALSVRWLDVLARLIQEHKQLLQTISSRQLTDCLESATCPVIIIELVLTMRDNHDLSLLPRVAASFRRRLASAGILVIDVTLAQKSDATLSKIKQFFGNSSVVIDEIDTSLLGGVRIVTPRTTFEYSLSNRLASLKHALAS